MEGLSSEMYKDNAEMFPDFDAQSSNNATMEISPQSASSALHETLSDSEAQEMCTNINASEEPHQATEKPSTKRQSSKSVRMPLIIQRKVPEEFVPVAPLLFDTQCVSSAAFYKLVESKGSAGSGKPLKSHIYVTSKTGSNFRLNFEAIDARLEPLYIAPRPIRPMGNEKNLQVQNHEEYVDVYNQRSSRPLMKILNFVVDEDVDNRKPELPPLKVFKAQSSFKSSEISRPKRMPTKGFIVINLDGIVMKIVVCPMPISKLRFPVSDEIKSFITKLGMPSNDSLTNRAQFLVRNKNDLLRISFTLSNPVLSQLPERKSIANQTESKFLLHTERSQISNKVMQLPIPESNYIYTDPMIEARNLNRHFENLNILPLWKYEMYHKRIAATRGGGSIQVELDKEVMRNRGSFVVFEGFNAVATANGGVFCGRIAEGLDKYEDHVYEYLDQYKTPKDTENVNSSAMLYWKPRVSKSGLTYTDLFLKCETIIKIFTKFVSEYFLKLNFICHMSV